jgi:hypothetical protein
VSGTRRVAGAHELDVLEPDPRAIRRSPEPVMFDELSKERDDSLSAVGVRGREVDFVAEKDEPAADLCGRKDDAVRRLAVLAVLLERLEDELWSRRGRKVEADDVEIGQLAEGAEESHRFTGARRTAQQDGLVLRQPRVQCFFVSCRIDGGDDDVRRRDGLSFDVDDGDRVLPGDPCATANLDVEIDERIAERHGRDFDARLLAEEVAHVGAGAELRVAGEGPHEADEQPLQHVRFDLLARQREIGVSAVVIGHVADRLVDEGEKGLESSTLGEGHDVLDSGGVLERTQDEAIRVEGGFEDVGSGALGGEQGGLVVGSSSLIVEPVGRRESGRLERCEVMLAVHRRTNRVFAEPDHAAATDGRERGVLQRLDFEEDAHVRWQAQTLAIRQSQQLVVVENTGER